MCYCWLPCSQETENRWRLGLFRRGEAGAVPSNRIDLLSNRVEQSAQMAGNESIDLTV